MVFNKTYNTRHSGRYNTSGQFVSAGVTQQSQSAPFQPPPQQQQPQPQPQSFSQQPLPQRQSSSNQNAQNSTPAPPPPQPQPQPQSQPPPQLQVPEIEMKPDPDAEPSADDPQRPHWMKSKLPGIKKLTKKEKRRRQNEHLRRIITPKNALMVLNEMMLHDQLTNQFKVEPAEAPTQYYKTQKTSFCADLTLDGVTYKGYGENKLMARNAAAEQAIRDLIIKRMNKAVSLDLSAEAATSDNPLENLPEEDPLPMIQLASYALHKLFSEWEYEGHKVPQLRPPSISQGELDTELIAPTPRPRAPAAKKPPKELPLNAPAMHPCMLLTYMRPHLEYRELAAEGDRPQNMLFTMGVDVDGATYIGKASNKKEARKAAARSACQALFSVKFDEVATANAPVVPTA